MGLPWVIWFAPLKLIWFALPPKTSPPHAKSWLIGKDPDAGRDWGQEEKGMIEDEMAGWHHQLNGHEFEWTLGVGDGQGGLVCCDSWGHKELDMTEPLNLTDGYTVNWRSSLRSSTLTGFSSGLDGKESAYSVGALVLIPESERSPGEGNGYPLQYSFLENSWTEEPDRLQSMRSQESAFIECEMFTDW